MAVQMSGQMAFEAGTPRTTVRASITLKWLLSCMYQPVFSHIPHDFTAYLAYFGVRLKNIKMNLKICQIEQSCFVSPGGPFLGGTSRQLSRGISSCSLGTEPSESRLHIDIRTLAIDLIALTESS